jgi:thioesterase domain-containing protein
MLAELSRMRGRVIPLSWLFESSTIEGLVARLVSDLHASAEPPLVVLQGDAPGTPIAFVHGDGHGGGWYCRRLAPLVAPDAPFYVLPTLGAEDAQQTWRIERMAARHVAELRKVRPHGPYRLGGFCVGGLIAFEMARQLRAAGETVEKLVTIDTAATNARIAFVKPLLALVPGADEFARFARQATFMKRLRYYFMRARHVRRLDNDRRMRWLRNHLTRRFANVASVVGVPSSVSGALGPATLPVRERRVHPYTVGDRVMEAQERAGMVYVPGKYDGHVDAVYAVRSLDVHRLDPTRGFWCVARSVDVHPIVAEHISLITNDLPKLAQKLRAIFGHEER